MRERKRRKRERWKEEEKIWYVRGERKKKNIDEIERNRLEGERGKGKKKVMKWYNVMFEM